MLDFLRNFGKKETPTERIKKMTKRVIRHYVLIVAAWATGIATIVLLVAVMIATIMGVPSGCGDQASDSGGELGKSGVKITINSTEIGGYKTFKEIADKVGKQLGVDPHWVFGQMALESRGEGGDHGLGMSPVAQEGRNYSGITWYVGSLGNHGSLQGDVSKPSPYAYYKNNSDYATEYYNTLYSDFKEYNGGKVPGNITEYTKVLQKANYFTDNFDHYLGSMKSTSKEYDTDGGGKAKPIKDNEANSDTDSSDCSADSVASGNWAWPFKSIKGSPQISGAQLFGHVGGGRTNGFHDGIDFGTSPYNNQDILAIHGGKVYKIDHQGYTQNDLGWYVCVKSDDGYYEVYQEFAFADGDRDAIKVKEGDTVKTGDTIAVLSTKYSNATHVHIGVSKTEISKALSKSFTDDGTWIDWTKLVKGEK